MKILIADKFQQRGIDELKSVASQVAYEPDATAESLPQRVQQHDPDVLVVRSTKVKAPVFEAAKRLTLVVRAGAGVDNIDVPAASARGISVANCPGKNSIAVAELVWGLILSSTAVSPIRRRTCAAARGTRRSIRRPAGFTAARWA